MRMRTRVLITLFWITWAMLALSPAAQAVTR